MEVILVLKQSDIDPNTPLLDSTTYSLRRAARAVLFDEAKQVALLYVGRDTYHKLPGGGVEDGETIEEALYREILEETGCRADILRTIGRIIEQRDTDRLIQESDCFLMCVRGEKGQPQFDQFEREQNCAVHWFSSIDVAARTLANEPPPVTTVGKMVLRRELYILQQARGLLTT